MVPITMPMINWSRRLFNDVLTTLIKRNMRVEHIIVGRKSANCLKILKLISMPE